MSESKVVPQPPPGQAPILLSEKTADKSDELSSPATKPTAVDHPTKLKVLKKKGTIGFSINDILEKLS